jgi:tRNA dimethylallyltransferase
MDACRIVALVGPTAVGKSAVAVELAQALDAEIVCCDSMQVYRGMGVLSQAPTLSQRAQVPHHLLECVEPTESCNAGAYRTRALAVIEHLAARGTRVLIVGGTGLYLRAITEGLCEAPPADARVRSELWEECRGVGSARLHDRLQAVDAAAASRIHPHDVRRIIRALEVHAVSGKPLSSWWRQTTPALNQHGVRIIGLTRERQALCRRITERLLHMIYEEGVINEARALLRLELSTTARQVHGLGDLERYLGGEMSLKETIATWQQRVRQYAKRQLVWFRGTPGIEWVQIPEEERAWQTSALVIERLRQPGAVVAAGGNGDGG